MKELAGLIPSSMVSLIGLAVLMGILIMLGTFFQEFAKKLIRTRNGGERRRESDQWFDRFIEAQKEYVASNQRIAEEFKGFSENIAAMTRGMERRAGQALEQHDVIIEKIDDLDVPRKVRRY